jgi:hypothetical protein
LSCQISDRDGNVVRLTGRLPPSLGPFRVRKAVSPCILFFRTINRPADWSLLPKFRPQMIELDIGAHLLTPISHRSRISWLRRPQRSPSATFSHDAIATRDRVQHGAPLVERFLPLGKNGGLRSERLGNLPCGLTTSRHSSINCQGRK